MPPPIPNKPANVPAIIPNNNKLKISKNIIFIYDSEKYYFLNIDVQINNFKGRTHSQVGRVRFFCAAKKRNPTKVYFKGKCRVNSKARSYKFF